jgi:hypothetical protein
MSNLHLDVGTHANNTTSHTMSFDQLLPVFLSTPIETSANTGFFKFTGGFELSTRTIGLMLALQGVFSMLMQLFVFPVVVRRFGNLGTFRFMALCYPAIYFLVPYLSLLPKGLQMPGIALILMAKITAAVHAYPSNAILLTNAAPSTLVLGTINGVAASTASLARAFGPTFSGLIYSAGLKMGYSGLAWWVSALVAIFGAIECFWMVETEGGRFGEEEIDIDEPALEEEFLDCPMLPAADAREEVYEDDPLLTKAGLGLHVEDVVMPSISNTT